MVFTNEKMFIPSEQGKKFNFEGFTLILPAVAIGNVGQLAVDILIFNLSPKRIGFLYDSSILPLVGNDPFTKPGEGEGNLVTSAEVYQCDEKKLIIIQQRAPVAKGCKQIYCERIVKWIKECQFKKTVLLTSCLASERIDSQIQSGPFRFVSNPLARFLDESFQKDFGWKALEKRTGSPAENSDDEVFLPGGGLSKRFYQTCCAEEVPLVMLLVFCAEGDNIPDAIILLQFADVWLQLRQESKVGKVTIW